MLKYLLGTILSSVAFAPVAEVGAMLSQYSESDQLRLAPYVAKAKSGMQTTFTDGSGGTACILGHDELGIETVKLIIINTKLNRGGTCAIGLLTNSPYVVYDHKSFLTGFLVDVPKEGGEFTLVTTTEKTQAYNMPTSYYRCPKLFDVICWYDEAEKAERLK